MRVFIEGSAPIATDTAQFCAITVALPHGDRPIRAAPTERSWAIRHQVVEEPVTKIGRRGFLQMTGAGAAAKLGGLAGILASQRAPALAQAASVHWLRWADFVPASDALLKGEITAECQKALGIKLTVETINANDIQARITSAIQSGTGPDIVNVLNNWAHLYGESLVEVGDIAEELGKAQGGFHETARAAAHDGKRWLAVPFNIVGV